MSDVDSTLDEVRQKIKTDDKVMAEARRRRDSVLGTAAGFRGVRYTIKSGSVAMGVVNDPVNDADGGIVLDRRVYPDLGPDGDGGIPDSVIDDLHDFMGAEVRKTWSKATVHNMKRGVTVCMHDPVLGDQDPYVDVVVGMERATGSGLWIPNLTQSRWDASHPQRHVELMLAGPDDVRRARARVARLAKAWNNQFSDPALSSFNLVALALEAVTSTSTIAVALHGFFDYSTRALRNGLTADPAGVSDPIKTLLRKDIAVSRLLAARDNLSTAMASKDADEIATALYSLYWLYLPEPAMVGSKASIAQALRTGTPRLQVAGSGLLIAGTMKPQRAFGDHDR
jgi:hypothetical protein